MRKVWFLVILIMVLLTGYVIRTTYAKYLTQATATAEKVAGAWVIKINNMNITSPTGATQSFTINNLNYGSNAYVADNKMAPGTTGSLDIAIDPTGTTTAVRFDVTLDASSLNISDAISMTSACKVIDGNEDSSGMTRTGQNTYSGIITLAEVEANKVTTARFYIAWTNVEANNAADSAIGVTRNVNLNIPIDVTVTQYNGETITAYVEPSPTATPTPTPTP